MVGQLLIKSAHFSSYFGECGSEFLQLSFVIFSLFNGGDAIFCFLVWLFQGCLQLMT